MELFRLIGLKNIFARQLPNMPKEYIVRLVMDRYVHLLHVIFLGSEKMRPEMHISNFNFEVFYLTSPFRGIGHSSLRSLVCFLFVLDWCIFLVTLNFNLQKPQVGDGHKTKSSCWWHHISPICQVLFYHIECISANYWVEKVKKKTHTNSLSLSDVRLLI